MILLSEKTDMTLQTYLPQEEDAMTLQPYLPQEEDAMTHQTCHLLGNSQGEQGRLKVKIHHPPEKSPAHHQVKNVPLMLIDHHWQRELKIGTIQTRTSHLHEENH